jgi:hypothetical protein
MTELEISLTLGLVVEPEMNRVHMDPVLHAEIHYLRHIFAINKMQREEVGRVNTDVWAELLPWHSVN